MILFSQCRFLIEYFTEKENEKKYIKRWKKAAGFPAAFFKHFFEHLRALEETKKVNGKN